MSVKATPKRLYQFDLLRLSLVLLALTSHYMISQEWKSLLSVDTYQAIKLFTRTAMPCLLIIFGFMFEYVYASRWHLKGPSNILERMLIRAVLCYAAFITLSFVGFLAGHSSFLRFGASAFFLTDVLHATVFKYYAILIPVIFFLMWIRFKYGWKVKIATVLSFILLVELIQFTAWQPSSLLLHFTSLMIGLGDSWGPSVVHSLVLVLFGELIANTVQNRKFNFQLQLLLLLSLLSVSLLVVEISSVGWKDFASQIVFFQGYRSTNSHVYFAYGIVAFLIYWMEFSVVVQLLSSRTKEWLSRYGGETLTIFFYGNLIILITPVLTKDIALSFTFLVITLLASIYSVNALAWAGKKFSVIKVIDSKIKALGTALFHIVNRGFAKTQLVEKKSIVTKSTSEPMLSKWSLANTRSGTSGIKEETSVLEKSK